MQTASDLRFFLQGFLPGAAAPDSSDGTDEAFG